MASRCVTCSPGPNRLEAVHQNHRLSESHDQAAGRPTYGRPAQYDWNKDFSIGAAYYTLIDAGRPR